MESLQDNMPNTFNPPKSEKMLTIEVSGREAHLIKILRSIDFGKVIVQKMNGQLVRVEPSVSVLLDEKQGLTLLDEKVL